MTAAPEQLRVLSYNVRSLRDDGSAVVRVIRECRADIVCVQEAPRFLRWRAKCAALARDTGLDIVTGGRRAGAMLLLARPGVEVLDRRNVLLRKAPRLHQRGLAVGVFAGPGGPVTVASMHLDLEAEERRRHVTEIFDRLADLPHPLVLAGDVNERPGEPAWAALADRLPDAYLLAPWGEEHTYSAIRPHKRIDGIFVDRRLRVVSCGVPPVAELAVASDHRPVLAVVRR